MWPVSSLQIPITSETFTSKTDKLRYYSGRSYRSLSEGSYSSLDRKVQDVALKALAEMSPEFALHMALQANADGYPIELAVEQNDMEVVRAFCDLCKTEELKLLALQSSKNGRTVLHTAVESKNLKMIEAICSLCTTERIREHVLQRDKYGLTLLHHAVNTGSVEILKAIGNLCNTENLKVIALWANQGGRTPLDLAITSKTEVVKFICKLCDTEKLKSVVLNKNLLYKALKCGNIEILKAVCELYDTDDLKIKVLKNDKNFFGILNFNEESTLLKQALKNKDIRFFEEIWGLCSGDCLKIEALKGLNVLSVLFNTMERTNVNITAELLYLCPWESLFTFDKDQEPLVKFSTKKIQNLFQALDYAPSLTLEKQILVKSYFFLRHDRLQEFDVLWQGVLKQEELAAKLLVPIARSDAMFIQVLLEQLGTTVKEKLKNLHDELFHISLLPLLKADSIVQKIHALPAPQKNEALNQTITVENVSDKPAFLLSALYQERAQHIQWDKEEDSNTSRFLVASLQNGLKQFSYITLALLAHDKQSLPELLSCLPALSDLQLTVVIPQLAENVFIDTLHHWKSTERIFLLLSKATIAQKQAFIHSYENVLIGQPLERWGSAFDTLKAKVDSVVPEKFAQEKFSLQQKLALFPIYLKRLEKIYREDNFIIDCERLSALQHELDAKRKTLQELQPAMCMQEDTPDEYLCPISRELMEDPVFIEVGKIKRIYDRSSIVHWVETSLHSQNPFSDPLTREPLLTKEEMQQSSPLQVFKNKLKSAWELKEAIAAFIPRAV